MLLLLDLAATVCFAYIGALVAFRHNASCVGVILSAMLTATGGGTVRDVLLSSDHIFWMENNQYLFAIAVAIPLAFLVRNKVNLHSRTLVFADSLSIAVFVLVGVCAAQNVDCGTITTVLMGILTGIGGSVLREAIVENHSALLRDQTSTLSVAISSIAATWLVHSQANLLAHGQINLVVSVVVIGVFLFICECFSHTIFSKENEADQTNMKFAPMKLQPELTTKTSLSPNLAAQRRLAKKSRFASAK